jgi:hypothetical protein
MSDHLDTHLKDKSDHMQLHVLYIRIWEVQSAGDKRVHYRERTMSKPLGVGIIGAGPVTQAIHLPTLASLGDRLKVVHIMDVNAEVGALVASRTGARSTTSVQTLLEDPEVDVVAICSPGQFHAAASSRRRPRSGQARHSLREALGNDCRKRLN